MLSETQFVAMRSRFGTLRELADAALIDPNYANGTDITGYVYLSSGVSEETYCIHAVRTSGSVARHDYVVCEDGAIYRVESITPNQVKRGEGVPLDDSNSTH